MALVTARACRAFELAQTATPDPQSASPTVFNCRRRSGNAMEVSGLLWEARYPGQSFLVACSCITSELGCSLILFTAKRLQHIHLVISLFLRRALCKEFKQTSAGEVASGSTQRLADPSVGATFDFLVLRPGRGRDENICTFVINISLRVYR